MTLPVAGRCDCSAPARCPRAATCAAEVWDALAPGLAVNRAGLCDLFTTCMSPAFACASGGPCPPVMKPESGPGLTP